MAWQQLRDSTESERKQEIQKRTGSQAEAGCGKHYAGSSPAGTAPSKRPVRQRYSVLPEQPLAARNPLAMGMVVAASLYCGAKAGIQGYQQLRRRNLRHLVRHVAPVLDDLGVQYWADFGTLLGMYRENDVILYDNDADLVVFNPNWDQLLADLRQRLRGCRVFFVVPSEDTSIKWIRVMAGVGIMDLVAIPQGHGNLCDIPKDLIFPLGTMKFRGVAVSVPVNVPDVLRYRYGETFMIPRYMDKGRDCVEQGKLYAKLLGALGKAGLRV
eukprot:gene2323-2631_t